MRDSEVRSTILSFVTHTVAGHPSSIDRMEEGIETITIYMKDGRKYLLELKELFDYEEEINFKY